MRRVYFISKDSSWQKYRGDIMNKLAQQHDLSVTVLSSGQLRDYVHGNDRVRYDLYRSWLPTKSRFSFFPAALVRIVRDRPDAVLAQSYVSQLTEMVALPLCKMLGIRFVWWTHGYDHGEPNLPPVLRGLKRRFVMLIYRHADAIITYSPAGRDYVIGHSVPAGKVFCAPNTLDTDSLLEAAARLRGQDVRQEVSRQLGIGDDKQVILFCGRLMPRKCVDHAVLAVSRVIARCSRAHLLVVGDGPVRGELERLAQELIPDNCTFLGEIYDEEKLARIFSRAEILLMPKAVGLSIVHAFCFGLPLITEQADRHGPEIQYLHDGYNGLYARADDIENLAAKLETLLTDESKRAAMSHNAVETIRNEANVRNMVGQMAAALLNGRRA